MSACLPLKLDLCVIIFLNTVAHLLRKKNIRFETLQ